jgi:hypothetical protein
MKKALPKILFILLIVGVIFGGKKIIDYKTSPYEKIVDDALTKYFVSGDVTELKPVIALLEEYQKEDVKRKEIQSYSSSVVTSWYIYLDNKYYCDNVNVNSCQAQLAEFKILNNKLTNLYETKCEDGFTIIVPSKHTDLNKQGSIKVEALERAVANPGAISPQDSEKIRLTKCATAVDCDSCRENLCVCYYVDAQTKDREPVKCIVNKTN